MQQLQISGDANEEQILTSASVYRDRPIMLTKVKCAMIIFSFYKFHFE